MKKIIGYPILVISIILLFWSAIDAVITFGDVYGFWIGLLSLTAIPIALLFRSIVFIYFNGDWYELIFNLIFVGLILLSNRMLSTKYVIKKPKELHINEKNLPQITKYDTLKALFSIPLVYYGVIFGAALTLIIGVALIFLIYYLEASATESVHVGILAAIGLGALFGIYGSLNAIIRSFIRRPDLVIGFIIKDKESPIFKITREVANRINAKIPENILVVYNPDLHVQIANSKLVTGEKIEGNTLTIGFPFLKYLSISEIKAVVCHEMAHFTGKDTVFSTRVAPAYRSLKIWVSNLGTLTGDDETSGAAKLPNLLPLLMANGVFNWYIKNLSHVDRVREARADMIGSICYGTNVFSNALKKVKQVGYIFNEASDRDQFEYASSGKSIDNYFQYFDENYMHDKKLKDFLDDIIQKDKITSEFDSHYSFEERIAYLPDDNVVDYSTSEKILDTPTMKSYEEKLSKMYSSHINNLFSLINSIKEQTQTIEENNMNQEEQTESSERQKGELLDLPECPKCGRRFCDTIKICRYCNVPLLRYSNNSSKKISKRNNQIKFCKKCGEILEIESKFCKNCGSKVE